MGELTESPCSFGLGMGAVSPFFINAFGHFEGHYRLYKVQCYSTDWLRCRHLTPGYECAPHSRINLSIVNACIPLLK